MRIDPNPTFTSPVKLTVPGEQELAQISVTWRHKGRDQLKEWAARPLLATAAGIVPLEVEAEYLAEVIESWDGPRDPAGGKVAFSTQALGRLLQSYPAAGEELYRQYLRAMTESRLKN